MRFAPTIAATVAALILTAATPTAKKPTAFAAGATNLWECMWTNGGENALPIAVTSPDGSTVVTASFDAKAGNVFLTIRSSSLNSTVNIGPGVQSALEWSPDSKAFFVTTSDEGANGWYHTLVYFVERDAIQKIDPTPVVLGAFGHPFKCGWHEDPNVGAIEWLSNSERILIAAEVMNHSNCDSFGTFKAYELTLPEMRIVKTLGQLEAKKLFRDSLGWEIKDAPDRCIRDPKSCWVSANHESRH
jgi:hypothetical protein